MLTNEPPEDFGAVARLFALAKPYMEQLIVISVLMVLGSAFGLILPFAAGRIIDIALSTQEQFDALRKYMFYVFLMLVLMAVVNYVSLYWLCRVGAKFLKDLRLSLYGKILSMPMSFFAKNSAGDLNSRLGVSISTIQRVVTLQIPKGIQCIFRLNICIIMLFFMQIKMTMAALLVVPVIALTAFFFGKRIQNLSAIEQDALAAASANVEETVNGIMTVQAFRQENKEKEKYQSRHLEKIFDIQNKNAHLISLFSAAIQFFIFGALVMVFWYGGTLIVNGEITAGKLTTYIMYAVYMSASMVEIGMHYTSLKELTGASKRIFEIMDEEPDLEDSGQLSILDLATKDIEFKSVSFSYPQKREAAVSKLSFLVREGETVAFVGASGSGKSTLFKLLLRFYDVQSGAITIGGKNIKDFKLAEIRQLFGLVSQDTHLFSGTVHENVAYATERSVEDVEHAIAYAGAHEFVNRLPKGIYEAIGTGGVELSGGQKQRLSIARAYFAAPEIFLLDEATSALDADSEKYFQESLEMRKNKKTTLIIAHRMSTIRSADKIVVLDKGEIVDMGSHDVLIEKSEIYRRYCTLQSMLPTAGLELVS